MRKNFRACLIVSLLLSMVLLQTGCAGVGKSATDPGTTPAVSVSDALVQAEGCATALATLTQAGPMDEETKKQADGWAKWLDFALKAAGIVVAATGV